METINEDNSNNDLEELNSWDPMGEFWNSPANSMAIDPKNPVAFHLGKNLSLGSKIGDVIICEHYARRGKCADGNYCDRLHIDPRKRDKIIEVQAQLNQSNNRVLLNVSYLSPQNYQSNENKLLLVAITQVKSPNLFHLVVPYETLDLTPITDKEDMEFYIKHVLTKSDSSRQLKKISDLLQEMYGSVYRMDNVNDPILPSQIVACKQPDGRFRRAIVIQVPNKFLNPFDEDYESLENTHYKLFLIDIGVEGWFKRETIFDIKAHCLSDAPMALTCTLNLKPANNSKEWSQEAIDYFKSLVLMQNKYLLCKIKKENVDLASYIDGYEVELFDVMTRENFGDQLIERDLAHKNDNNN